MPDSTALDPAAIAAKWEVRASDAEAHLSKHAREWPTFTGEIALLRDDAAEARHIARALRDSMRLDRVQLMLQNGESVDAFWRDSRCTSDLRKSLDEVAASIAASRPAAGGTDAV